MRCWIISILMVLAGATYVQCQQASDSNKVSYEGQNVAAVDVIANPKISVDSLRPLVQQKSGEGYSGSKVENTISALRGTGRFSKVEVEVEPDPGGLHVTFTLEPALYFGVVDFHVNLGKRAKVGNVEVRGPEPAEANRLLHSTRSLRATASGASLKTGKSYTPKRIDSAIALIKRDLANHHHLASKVHLDEPRYHQDTNHADIIIDTRDGPIVRVRVMGAKLAWLPFLR